VAHSEAKAARPDSLPCGPATKREPLGLGAVPLRCLPSRQVEKIGQPYARSPRSFAPNSLVPRA
jgi:hypothetical protein